MRGKEILAREYIGATVALCLLAGAAPAGAGGSAPAGNPVRSASAAPGEAATGADAGDDSGPDDAADAAGDMAGGDVLDNDGVVALTRAGLGDPAIAAMVRTSTPHFDVSTPALLALRHAGVGSTVLAAMIRTQKKADAAVVQPASPDPMQPHPAGVYVLADWLSAPRMMALHPAMTTRTTSGSILGYAFSGGLASVGYRAILPGAHAGLTAAGKRPVFYFFTGAKQAGGAELAMAAAPSPADLALVRLAVGKAGREVRIGSFNIQGARTGIRPQDRIAFRAVQVARGVVEVRPEVDLAPGEYGFIQTAVGVGIGAARVSTTSARIFAFAVGEAGSLLDRPEMPGSKTVTGPGMDKLEIDPGRTAKVLYPKRRKR